jgi:hypothetical protein
MRSQRLQRRKRISLTEQALREAREALKARSELLGPDSTSKLVSLAKTLLDENSKGPEPDAPDPTIWTDPAIWENNRPWGDRSCDMASWIEERAIIDRAFAQVGRKVVESTKSGGRKNPERDLKIWLEFRERRPKSHKSPTALTKEIARKYGIQSPSSAIAARERGKKLFGLGRTERR